LKIDCTRPTHGANFGEPVDSRGSGSLWVTLAVTFFAKLRTLQPVAYLEIWKGGAARIFGDLFLGRRPTSKIPVTKNFDDLFFFSNFSHFFDFTP
jgi:hypothetical protein